MYRCQVRSFELRQKVLGKKTTSTDDVIMSRCNICITLKQNVIGYTSFGQMINVVAINTSSECQLRN